jgi:hypothetical protein
LTTDQLKVTAMPISDSTPYASWPRHLQASWRDCAERGEVDGDIPPTSIVEAYLIVAQVRVRRLAGIPWGDGTHDLADLTPTRTVCARCGAGDLEHFYTSKRTGKILCPVCHHR